MKKKMLVAVVLVVIVAVVGVFFCGAMRPEQRRTKPSLRGFAPFIRKNKKITLSRMPKGRISSRR